MTNRARTITKISNPDSELEQTLWLQLRCAGLPMPERQVMFAKNIGRRWLFDFAWIDARLAVEVQGGIWMAKGAHNTGKAIMRDAEKLANAVLLGWRVLYVTKEHIDNLQALDWIKRALDQRRENVPL